ncbi:unnamed protein product [Auanema sp. JU1783]|nr:unnamed protein product [Auanema sp. JU1783]
MSSNNLDSIFIPSCEILRPEDGNDLDYLFRVPAAYDQIGYDGFPSGLREQLGILETNLLETVRKTPKEFCEPFFRRIHPILEFLVSQFKTLEAFADMLRSVKEVKPQKLSIICSLARIVPLRTSDYFQEYLDSRPADSMEIKFMKRLMNVDCYQQRLMLCMYVSRAEAMYKLCDEAFQAYMRLGYNLASHPIAIDSTLTYRIQRFYMSRIFHDSFDDIVDELKEDPNIAADFMYLFPAIEALSKLDPVIIADSRFFCERDYKRFVSKFTRASDTEFGIAEKLKPFLEEYEVKFDNLDELVKKNVDDMMGVFNGNVAGNETVADYYKAYLEVFEKIKEDYERGDEEVADEEMAEDPEDMEDESIDDEDEDEDEEEDEEIEEDEDEEEDEEIEEDANEMHEDVEDSNEHEDVENSNEHEDVEDSNEHEESSTESDSSDEVVVQYHNDPSVL